jgi:hypothetical protein
VGGMTVSRHTLLPVSRRFLLRLFRSKGALLNCLLVAIIILTNDYYYN